MKINDFIFKLNKGDYDLQFKTLYGNRESERQNARYEKAVLEFKKNYPKHKNSEISVFSAPGRTEIGGNHTDHQHGCVLAAAVNLDVIGVAAFHNEGVIRVKSEGYDPFEVSLDDLAVRENEKGSSEIVRGIVSKFSQLGVKTEGFDLYTTSDVLSGSGISSSAAFETLIGTIIDCHYNDGRAGAVEIAKIGQYAENVYFGKNSGLMDQMVSSVGGLVAIDFKDTENPVINSFGCDFEKFGYCICITDTKGSHADLTDDYAAVRSEMESIAAYFGKEYLREVCEEEFYREIPNLRKICNDRAVLRGMHFFSENRRAQKETDALVKGNFERFLELVRQSGDSSANLLQNLYSVTKPVNQEMPLAVAVSKRILKDKGAVRVHGGGFAGTVQAFVPRGTMEKYLSEMERIFGKDSCLILHIRPFGGIEITKETE